jgi:predicted nucleic acid-binding protein
MMSIVADTNVIIPTLVESHEFSARARSALAEPLQNGELLLPQHVLLESYSVVTRSPAPLRLKPQVAFELLHKTYGACRIISVSAGDIWRFLRERDERTSGGRLYDAIIAIAAIEAGAKRLLTFNPRHFETFADRIEVVVPA